MTRRPSPAPSAVILKDTIMHSLPLCPAASRSSFLARSGLLAVLALFALASPFAAGSALAQEPAAIALVRVDVAVVASGYRVSTLLHRAVQNSQNQKIGTIDDIIIGHDDRALFAILEVGGFLGIGAHLVAVPYQSLQIDDVSKKITLPGGTQAALKDLQEFKYKK